MKNYILKILRYFLNLQEKNKEEKLNDALKSSNRGIKTHLTGADSLVIKNAVLDEMRTKLINFVTPIVKKNLDKPENLLKYIEKKGTKVYKIANADRILRIIKEQEGFITPIKGYRALYLNLILERKIKLETPEMFILRDLPLNIYFMTHQFYKWYGYKIEMPGYDNETQEMFKRVWTYQAQKNVKKLSYEELVNLKEAITRDIEAVDFVLKLARENEGAKKGYKNIKDDGEASV